MDNHFITDKGIIVMGQRIDVIAKRLEQEQARRSVYPPSGPPTDFIGDVEWLLRELQEVIAYGEVVQQRLNLANAELARFRARERTKSRVAARENTNGVSDVHRRAGSMVGEA